MMEINPYIAPVCALLALVVSLRSSIYARRALRIAEADHDSKTRSLALYLIKGLRVRSAEKVYASFAISLTNPSTLPEGVSRIDLRISFTDVAGKMGCTIVAAEPDIVLPKALADATRLKTPFNLAPRASEQGWLSYEIPAIIHKERMIEKYQLCARTGDTAQSVIDVYVLSDILET